MLNRRGFLGSLAATVIAWFAPARAGADTMTAEHLNAMVQTFVRRDYESERVHEVLRGLTDREKLVLYAARAEGERARFDMLIDDWKQSQTMK